MVLSSPLGGDGARRYRLRRLIGTGGFGRVYQAEMSADGGFTREVAIKLLDPTRFSGDEPLRRLRDEARVLGRIRHRAVVNIYALSRLDPGWAIIMEYVEGVDIGKVVASGGLPPRAALAAVEEIASLLRCAWEQPSGDGGAPLRLIHRDIKPSNLRLTPDGAVKVLDFGTAKADIEDREGQSEELLLGSVKFMAPERFRGVDGTPGDIYALGLVLGELLVGRPLAATSPGELEHQRLSSQLRTALEQALRPHRLHASQERSILELVEGMTRFAPEERLRADTVELWAQRLWTQLSGRTLREWARAEVPRLVDAQLRQPETDALSGSVLVERGREAPTPGRAGWSWAFFAATALGVVGVAGVLATTAAGWWWWRTGEVAPEPETTGMTAAEAESTSAPAPAEAPAAKASVSPSAEPPSRPTSPATRTAAPSTPTPSTPSTASTPVISPVASGPPAPTGAAPAGVVVPTPSSAASPALPADEAPAPTTAMGTVVVVGDAERVMLERDGTRLPPGPVPVGSWKVQADFGDGALSYAGKVQVTEGGTIKLRCAAGFRECRPG